MTRTSTFSAFATVALPVRLWRLTRLTLHVFGGLVRVLTVFPRYTPARRHKMQRDWSRQLMAILNIRLRVLGSPPMALYPANTLLVANHVSWLDIFALNSVTITRFVAKSEIRRWPVLGTLVTRAGTLYIDRGNRRDAARINLNMAKALREGDCIGLFPEGTTSDGLSLLPFKASLFDAAAKAHATVQPVTLRFMNADNSISQAASYVGDTSLLQSIWMLASARGQVVELHYGQALSGHQRTRFELCAHAEREIAAGLQPAGQMPVRVGEAEEA